MMKKPATILPQVPWGIPAAFLVGAAAFILGDVLASGIVAAWLVSSGRAASVQEVLGLISEDLTLLFSVYAVSQIIMAGAVYAFVRSRGSSWQTLGFRRFKLRRAIGVVITGFVGFMIAAVLATAALEQVAPTVDLEAQQQIAFTAAGNQVEIILAFAALVIIAPLAEELLFRGFLLPALGRRLGVATAIIGSSLIFGLLHPPAVTMVIIGVFAIFLALAYTRSGSLWPAIILHSSKNLIAFIGLFGGMT